ncbi:MAG: hypothetical protein M3O30_13875 [Planctomycetota bacterium]|nr:hypothetical protein [Planctomycetota bacterium]
MSNQTTQPPISCQPVPLQAPREPWTQRVNWRIVIFAAVVILPIAGMFYVWVNETITGGIHNFGSYSEVDLKAMSTFDMDQTNATKQDIPEKWRQLEGKSVMMIGEMWAPKDAGDGKLSYFQLVYSKTKCCFSGPPLAQHFVDGNVNKGVNSYYYDTPVKVWGKLHVYIRKDPDGVIKSIYHVDVDKVEPLES